MGINHVYHNGHKASDFVTTSTVGRGVLLDMARHFDQNPPPEGTAFNDREIRAQAIAQVVTIGNGDVVLFHTGWLNLVGKDDVRFMAGQPADVGRPLS